VRRDRDMYVYASQCVRESASSFPLCVQSGRARAHGSESVWSASHKLPIPSSAYSPPLPATHTPSLSLSSLQQVISGFYNADVNAMFA